MVKLLLTLWVLCSLSAFGQNYKSDVDPNATKPGAAKSENAQQAAKEALQKQVTARLQDSELFVPLYTEMFKKGPDAKALTQLGELYLKERKPIQAASLFERALLLDANLADAQAGKKSATQTLDEKNDRIEKFTKMEEIEKDARHVCSRASILFHMGLLKEALNLLHEKHQKDYRNTEDIRYLEATFKRGVNVEKLAVQYAIGAFKHSLKTGDFDGALKAIAQYEFFSLGQGDPSGMVDALKETFPDKKETQNIMVALGKSKA